MGTSKNFFFIVLFLAVFLTFANAQTKPKVDLAKKVEEATPFALPQSPVTEKLKTDAEENNLKGRVKSIVEEVLTVGESNRLRDEENYYDERGNYVKSVSYLDGYPDSVTVWGYLDGNRVLKSNSVEYAEGERPASNVLTANVEDNVQDQNAPKDTRFSVQHKYKYNKQGLLVEKLIYANNGELWSRDVYKYKGNQKEKLNYGADGSQWSQTVVILDKDGNEVEEDLMDEQGKVGDKTTFSYEYDSKGNWIVQKAFENKKVKGKWIPKLSYITYRTIIYYP